MALLFSATLALGCSATEIGQGDSGNPPVIDDSSGGDQVTDPTLPQPPVNAITTGEELFTNDTIPTIQLNLTPSDWQTLNDTAVQELYVPGQATLLDETVTNIGIRYKGAFGSLYACFTNGIRNGNCDKLAIKLKFNEYVDGQRLFGLKRLNLHAMENDASFMREVLAYEAFRENGIKAPRTSYVKLQINGDDLGLYLAVENVDGRFTRSNFDDGGEGNLYKEVWPKSQQTNYYLEGLKTNEDEFPDVSNFVNFANAISSSSNEDFVSTLGQYVDPTHWIRYITLSRLVGHWDGVFAWYCGGSGANQQCNNHNFYWYQSRDNQKFTIVPWDYDNSFYFNHFQWEAGIPSWAEATTDCSVQYDLFGGKSIAPHCDPLLGKTRATMWEDYKALARPLLDGHFSNDNMSSRIDALIEQIDDAVANDPIRDYNNWLNHQNTLRNLVVEKANIVEAEITNN